MAIAVDYSKSFEAELDACVSQDEMLAKTDQILAAHWDGHSAPTVSQYKGGRIRGDVELVQLLDVLDGKRQMCLLDAGYTEGANLSKLRTVLQARGLHMVECYWDKSHEYCASTEKKSTAADVFVCARPATAARAQLIHVVLAEFREFDRKLRQYEQPVYWINRNQYNARLGILLGYTVHDVMFFLHRFVCEGGCVATDSKDCVHCK